MEMPYNVQLLCDVELSYDVKLPYDVKLANYLVLRRAYPWRAHWSRWKIAGRPLEQLKVSKFRSHIQEPFKPFKLV